MDGDPGAPQLEDHATQWASLLPKSPLTGDARNPFPLAPSSRVTHLRFKIYPDGGVARLRVHGEVLPDWAALKRNAGEIDLAAVEHGGWVVVSSDMFFGSRNNLILPGRSTGMHDGWETRRRRGPGHDWCIVRLGAAGRVSRVEVDTSYFKGNFPESCSLEVAAAPRERDRSGRAGGPSLERDSGADEAASGFAARLREGVEGLRGNHARAISHLPRRRRCAATHLRHFVEGSEVT